MSQPDVARAWSVAPALAWRELRAGLRSAAWRVLAALAFVYGWSTGNAPGRGASVSAYATGEAAWVALGLVAILWMSLAAVREAQMRTEAIIYAKPQTTERLVLARFGASMALALLLVAAMFAGAACGRLSVSGSVAGFAAYGGQFARAGVAVFFGGAASYCLALLTASPVAGAVVGLYWVVMIAGREHLAKVFYPAYTQNLALYVGLGVLLVCVAAIFHRRGRRGAAAASPWVRGAAAVALTFSLWSGWVVLRDGHDPQVWTHPTLERFGMQNLVVGRRAPGFLLPDQHGRPTSLAGLGDRIFVVALWSPRSRESAVLLERLSDLYARYGERGVLPVGICISEDSGAGVAFARGEGIRFPMVTDRGAHHAPRGAESSPLATAYRASSLPLVAVTDRRRRVRRTFSGIEAYDGSWLELEIERRLRMEPE
ncbi:MAG TPA: redoxin domain-containing protein [Chthonomonadales bacterium]|nr:redoxin domain-containing protein [Chthonomonadales bacterium]